MPKTGWQCPKCSCKLYDVGELRAAGGWLASLFDMNTRKFTTITCLECRYTELYQAAQTALDFLAH